MSEIEVLNMLVVSLEDKLKGEQERCIGWQEHAKSLARTLETISAFNKVIAKEMERKENE